MSLAVGRFVPPILLSFCGFFVGLAVSAHPGERFGERQAYLDSLPKLEIQSFCLEKEDQTFSPIQRVKVPEKYTNPRPIQTWIYGYDKPWGPNLVDGRCRKDGRRILIYVGYTDARSKGDLAGYWDRAAVSTTTVGGSPNICTHRSNPTVVYNYQVAVAEIYDSKGERRVAIELPFSRGEEIGQALQRATKEQTVDVLFDAPNRALPYVSVVDASVPRDDMKDFVVASSCYDKSGRLHLYEGPSPAVADECPSSKLVFEQNEYELRSHCGLLVPKLVSDVQIKAVTVPAEKNKVASEVHYKILRSSFQWNARTSPQELKVPTDLVPFLTYQNEVREALRQASPASPVRLRYDGRGQVVSIRRL